MKVYVLGSGQIALSNFFERRLAQSRSDLVDIEASLQLARIELDKGAAVQAAAAAAERAEAASSTALEAFQRASAELRAVEKAASDEPPQPATETCEGRRQNKCVRDTTP